MVTLKTDTGGILTATDHAMMNWIGFPYNVILSSSVNIVVNINTLSINDDIFGILAGRLYKITNESFTFPLPTSGTQAGVLYLKLDLNNVDNPLQLLSSIAADISGVVQEQNADSDIANFDKSKVVIKWLCSFTLTTSTITDVTVLIPYGDDADYITAIDTRLNMAETTVSQIADEYDPSVSYAVGDYCTYNGTIYRCTAATTGTFDPSKWTDSVIVMDAVKSLKGRMTTAESDIDAAQEDISALNQSLTPSSLSYTFTAGANVSLRGTSAVYKSGNIIHIGVYFDVTAQLANNATICTVSRNLPKPITSYVTAAVHGIASTEGLVQIERGDLTRIKTWGVLPAASYYYAQFCYMAE